jgi:hypothetical protein
MKLRTYRLTCTDIRLGSASSCTTRQHRLRTAFVVSSISASKPAMHRSARTAHLPPPLKHTADLNQKSRNSRLKDLEDRSSTNIYCTGVPIDWNESVSLIMVRQPPLTESQDLAKHFLPYHAVSTKICRDVPSGVSKEVGFARCSFLIPGPEGY